MPKVWIGPAAVAVALAEVGFWIHALAGSTSTKGGLQESNQATGSRISRLVPRRVLRGLLALARRADRGRDGRRDLYGYWVGRDNPRAYFGLMLFLTGAIIGVFTAQDLLLFYVFWEAMLIPLYVLIGVWGGPGRIRATITFVIYTMVGSLLMLGSIIVYGLQGTFASSTAGRAGATGSSSGSRSLHRQGAAVPVPRLAPDAYRESPPEVSRALGRDLEGGGVRLPAHLLFQRSRAGGRLPRPRSSAGAIGLVYGSLMAFRAPDIRGVIAYSSLAQMGLIMLGLSRRTRSASTARCCRWSTTA